MNNRHTPGCIEAAYAVLFLVCLVLLVLEFNNWVGGLVQHWPELSGNTRALEIIVCASIVVSVLQFSRIYHYIHQFDCHHNDGDHFISHLSGWHRKTDRALRWVAGLCVITTIEIWGERGLQEHSATAAANYDSLCHFAVALFITFALLFLWDINLVMWERKSTLTGSAKLSFDVYEPKLKRYQRMSGMAFSVCLFFVLRQPALDIWKFVFGASVITFLRLWIKDYNFSEANSWKKPFVETFSPVLTVVALFRGDSKCAPSVGG